MLNCHQVTRLASEALERRLSVRERLSMGFHTMMCAGCHNFRRQLLFLRSSMRAYVQGRDAGPQ